MATKKALKRVIVRSGQLGVLESALMVLVRVGSPDDKPVYVALVTEEDTYDDPEKGPITRTKVKWINRVGGAARVAKPMDDGQRKAFAARMKGVAMMSRPGAAAPAARPPVPQRTAPRANGAPAPSGEWDGQGRAPDDDIPF